MVQSRLESLMSPKQFNYLYEISRLIDAFRREGLETVANQLQQCIDEGSTGTEILMSLLWTLRQAQPAVSSLSDMTRERVKYVQNQIEMLLSR